MKTLHILYVWGQVDVVQQSAQHCIWLRDAAQVYMQFVYTSGIVASWCS